MSVFIATDFEELQEKLAKWVNFNEEGPYDFIGMMLLLKSCIENLQKYAMKEDFEELEDFFEDRELEVIKLILDSQV